MDIGRLIDGYIPTDTFFDAPYVDNTIDWDFDGKGAFPYSAPDIDGTQLAWTCTVEHRCAEAGTYLPAVKMTSHRDGDVSATGRRIENIARVWVVVSGPTAA
jgi:hypothetical protein